MITRQRLYGGVRLLGDGPSLRNIAKLDAQVIPCVNHMTQRGLQVDLAHFASMDIELTRLMDETTESVNSLTGVYCNLGSGDQVSELLFKTLKLKQLRPKLTKSGDRESVESDVLTAIQHDHPVVPLLLNYKEYEKLRGTYVRPMPKLARRVAHGGWRMFPNLKTTRVPSGRFSCDEPNLLAMPNRTALGRKLCEGFITDADWVFLSVDFSQIEPRVVAHRSRDVALMQAYHNDEDIYSDFAISAFKLPDERYQDAEGWHYPGVDKKKHRFPAKTCTLASIYDVTNVGLLEQMPIVCRKCLKEAADHQPTCKFQPLWNEDNCQDIITAFYNKYPGIVTMRRQDHARARRYGYVWSETGRLLHCIGVRSVLPWVVSSVLRELGNFPIQSLASDCLKLAAAAIYDDFADGGMLDICHPLLPIHDELLFECRADMAEELAAHVCSRFESVMSLNVPIKAGAATSESWGKLVK